MHEMSLMESALEIARSQAQRHGAARIHHMKLRIGELSGVVADALQLAFLVLTPGTAAEGARLELDVVPVVCNCHRCKREFRPPGAIYECPSCGRISADVRQGRQLELVSLEVS
jgi:hydrogenase nickel incorporation protein HypA/HybF